MTKLYTKNVWQDEILADEERYNILEDDDTPIESTVQIVLDTAVVQAGTALDADKMNNIEEGIDAIDDLVEELDSYPKYVPLTTPLTSTSWDGDAKTTANNGIIDLSSVFSAPAGIKAVSVFFATTSATASRISRLATNEANYDKGLEILGQVANIKNAISGVLPCDANGDVYFSCSGDLAAVYIRILGYWI